MPVIQCSRRSARARFVGARLEMSRVTNSNRASRKTFARASAIAAAAGSFCAFFANARSTLFWQETHECRPFKQTWVAVKPVARRLIAASNGIDKIERWIAADDVTVAKVVRFNSNL